MKETRESIPSFLRRKAGGRKKAWHWKVVWFSLTFFFLADIYSTADGKFWRYMLGTSLFGLGEGGGGVV